MQFVEAFDALGYKIKSTRIDWSAESDFGVCLAIWRVEMKFRENRSCLDTRIDCNPIEQWGDKSGNRKRIKHLHSSITKFDNAIDIIVLAGIPGTPYRDADPWKSIERKNFGWRIDFFDEKTGHFAASASRKINL
jgi:hypothetical protein